jgi:hypothetical protein
MIKLMDRYIRAGAVKKYLLHRNQQAYQRGKSTQTVFYNVVTRIGSAIEYRHIVLGAFLNTGEAFNGTTFDTVRQSSERQCIEPAICRWICAILESRNIIATLSG